MKRTVITLILVFLCVAVAAQSVVPIDSIVVTARRLHEIVPAQILDGQQLTRLETHSVADAIRYFSGVQVKDYGGIGGLKTVNVRSLGSAHVGVFYDGLAIGNAQNGVVDLGRFSLANVESVSLYNGQRSDIFQSARDFASAAAVYLRSRRPIFESGRGSNLSLRIAGGSFDLFDGSALFEQRLGENLSASANVQFLNTSGRYKYRYSGSGAGGNGSTGWDTTAVRRNGDIRIIRAETSLFGSIHRGEWRAKAYFYESDRGLPGAVIKEDNAISLRNEDRQRDRNFFIQGSMNQEISHLYSYRIQAKYAHDYTNYVMPPTTTLQTMDAHYRQQEAYISMANLFIVNHWLSANLSLDGQYNTLKADASKLFNKNFPQPRRLTLLGAAAVSMRFTKFSAQTSLLYTHTHDTSARELPMAADRNILSPTLVLAYNLSNTLEIRAFYKDIFRLPTFNDLYYTQIGNRALRPEYTTQYNVGATWRKSWNQSPLVSLSTSLDAYYNRVHDKIVATPTSNQLVWTMINIGRVRIRGIDASVTPQFRLGNGPRAAHIDTRITYTFQDTSGGDSVPYAPRHSGSAIVGITWGHPYDKGQPWSLNYSFIYTGERYRLGSQTSANLLEPWYTHDLALSRDLSLRKATIRLGVEVNNIFNQRYEVVRWYPMPGTNFKLLISISL